MRRFAPRACSARSDFCNRFARSSHGKRPHSAEMRVFFCWPLSSATLYAGRQAAQQVFKEDERAGTLKAFMLSINICKLAGDSCPARDLLASPSGRIAQSSIAVRSATTGAEEIPDRFVGSLRESRGRQT